MSLSSTVHTPQASPTQFDKHHGSFILLNDMNFFFWSINDMNLVYAIWGVGLFDTDSESDTVQVKLI